MAKRLSLLTLAAISGAAVAQTPVPPPRPPMPMPALISQLGDPDVVCTMSSMHAIAVVGAAKDLEPEKVASMMDYGRGQIAFYTGRLVARFTMTSAQSQLTGLAKGWFVDKPVIDKRPAMQWCLRNYGDALDVFTGLMDKALPLSIEMIKAKRPEPKAETLDQNAFCIVATGAALGYFTDEAKRNPEAKSKVQLLREAQSFYIGGYFAVTAKGSDPDRLANAFFYVQQRFNAKDQKTLNARIAACVDQYSDTRLKTWEAVSKGVESGKPDAKPAK